MLVTFAPMPFRRAFRPSRGPVKEVPFELLRTRMSKPCSFHFSPGHKRFFLSANRLVGAGRWRSGMLRQRPSLGRRLLRWGSRGIVWSALLLALVRPVILR